MRQTNACILLDVCSMVPNNDIEILENVKGPSGVNKAVFKARLQTLEEQNQNKRYYSKAIGDEIVEILKPKALGRSLFQEIDHPSIVGGDENSSRRRAVTVELKNCGTLIRDIYREGNDIIGEIETLSGFMGPDMYNLVVHDKADIGFSLRMFGKVEMNESTGIASVAKPIRPITYDTVTNPSHKTARVIEFLPENVNEFVGSRDSNIELINESIVIADNLDIENMNESVYDYVDRIVQNLFSQMGPIEFKI
jgi:hypothetical protein